MSGDRVPYLDEIGSVRASLRVLVEAVDAGEVEASPSERAYLAGTLDTLDRLADERPGGG